MKIKKIKLVNFRNFSKLELNLDDKLNIMIGDNAQGKTNFLESIVFLAITKSHRIGNIPNTIKNGCSTCKINGVILKNKVKSILEVEFNSDGVKKTFVNKTYIKNLSSYISNLNVIIFTPVDIDIVKSSPNIRRNLLNLELSQISNSYLNMYNEYNKLLKIRNEYLKKLSYNYTYSDKLYFDIITDKLIERAVPIYMKRLKFIDLINEKINLYFSKIMNDGNLNIKYVSNILLDSNDDEVISNNLRKMFESNYDREISYGMTLFGPHRDDFQFLLNDLDLKLYGSEGQQKISILCFKLSEIGIFKDITSFYPILLLDDIFSELDIKKRNLLLKIINSMNCQCIITTTDLKNISKKNLDYASIFEVNNGKVERSLKNGK